MDTRRFISSTTARVPAGTWSGKVSILPTAPKNSEPYSSKAHTPSGRSCAVCGLTLNSVPMRQMKKPQAAIRPISTATVRSNTTVRTKVPTNTVR